MDVALLVLALHAEVRSVAVLYIVDSDMHHTYSDTAGADESVVTFEQRTTCIAPSSLRYISPCYMTSMPIRFTDSTNLCGKCGPMHAAIRC